MQSSQSLTVVHKLQDGEISRVVDHLAVEEPLEIRLVYTTSNGKATKPVSVTMRTPGNDEELAIGFLFTEGIIRSGKEVEKVETIEDNKVDVRLRPGVEPQLQQTERNFYTTSSCGVCGKSSIEAIRTVSAFANTANDLYVQAPVLQQLPAQLVKQQQIFQSTGGLHASAMFDEKGNFIMLREDVGRHNALDKLIGKAFLDGLLPLKNHILLLSGRASFELIQKATMAGIQVVAAIGAPSSLAVQLAEESGITLIGFLKDNKFNIYTGEDRIKV